MENAQSADMSSLNISRMVDIIQNEDTPISIKMRHLFNLRSLNTPESSIGIQKLLSGTSVLLDHEIAYVLGQMQQPNSVEFLIQLAADNSANPIVRHEAIEALGNFSDPSLVQFIEPFTENKCKIISESAILAIRKLQDETSKESVYGSHDPSSPYCGRFSQATKMLKNGNLHEKYQAIFYFRDLNTKEAIEALGEGFRDESALLRHEVAFVLGQTENKEAVEVLVRVLSDESEDVIVRHEAAEALGNIGTERAKKCLTNFLNSEIRILRESAEVGLGIAEHPGESYFDI